MKLTFLRTPAGRLAALLLTFAVIAVVTALGPTEKTLGANIRLITLHGAWVWTGKIAFALAALTGLLRLVTRRVVWTDWSLALGRTGLFFWLTYLPMSLLMMQLNWGGFFFDEPRWQVPFSFGVVAVLVQVALALFSQPDLTALGNLLFGAALWWKLGLTENVLHPDSPIFQGGAFTIQMFFIVLLALSLLVLVQLALWLRAGRMKAA